MPTTEARRRTLQGEDACNAAIKASTAATEPAPAPQSLTRRQARRLCAIIKQAKPHQQVLARQQTRTRAGKVARSVASNKATSQAAAVLDNSNRSKPSLSKAILCWWNWTTGSQRCQQGALQSGKRWRRRTRRLTSSSEGGNRDERTENEADEAESHPAKASKAPQCDSGDKSTGSGTGARRQRRHVEPQGDAGRGHAPSPSQAEKQNMKQNKINIKSLEST